MQVIDRIVALLQASAEGRRTATELAAAARLSHTTASRLLRALCHSGILSEHPPGVYQLGRRVMELGCLADEPALLRLCRRCVDLVHAATGASAHAYRRAGGMRECVASANQVTGLRNVVAVGQREALGDDATGLVFRAWPPSLPAGPVVGGAGPEQEALLGDVRERGWAVTTTDCVTSIAVPARSLSQNVVVVLSVTGGPRLAVEADGLARRLRAAASHFEERLMAQNLDDRR